MQDSFSSGPPLRDLSDTSNFSVATISKTSVVSPGTSGTVAVLDTLRYSPHSAHAGTYGLSDLLVNLPLLDLSPNPTQFISLTPDVATVDSMGRLTALAAGIAEISVIAPDGSVRIAEVPIIDLNGLPVSPFVGFAASSLGMNLKTTIATKIAGLTSPIANATRPAAWSALLNIFQPDGFTRNTGGWWGSVDLTAIPAFAGQGQVSGALVTPRDMLIAKHFPGDEGRTVYFVDNANNRYARTVASIRYISGYSLSGEDIAVVTLNADLPTAITPVKLMPANLRSYLPTNYLQGCGYAAVATNQDRTLLLFDVVNIDVSSGITPVPPVDVDRGQWYYPVRRDDSGSGIFMLIGGRLVLLSRWHHSGSGPCDADNISQINSAIAANGSPYSLSTVDLSSFTAF